METCLVNTEDMTVDQLLEGMMEDTEFVHRGMKDQEVQEQVYMMELNYQVQDSRLARALMYL